MRALLDTHAFLWWILDDERMSARARSTIEDMRNELLLSAASGFEISVKASLGKLELPADPVRFVTEQLGINRIGTLPVSMSHALAVSVLPMHHRDPFDRLIIAQARVEGLPVITTDGQLGRYDIEIIW
jgi:PIN domain nuclease of toxin-antitoxin system